MQHGFLLKDVFFEDYMFCYEVVLCLLFIMNDVFYIGFFSGGCFYEGFLSMKSFLLRMLNNGFFSKALFF